LEVGRLKSEERSKKRTKKKHNKNNRNWAESKKPNAISQ
jgi:hypothetical protein